MTRCPFLETRRPAGFLYLGASKDAGKPVDQPDALGACMMKAFLRYLGSQVVCAAQPLGHAAGFYRLHGRHEHRGPARDRQMDTTPVTLEAMQTGGLSGTAPVRGEEFNSSNRRVPDPYARWCVGGGAEGRLPILIRARKKK